MLCPGGRGVSSVKNLFSSIYLVSKLASALITVLSIALFTRQVSHEIFGQYLIGFAFAFIAYSVVAQWLLGAHFGQQSREHAAPIAGGAVVLTGVSVLTGLPLIGLGVLVGVIPAALAGPTALLLSGFAAFFVANEIGRAQLLVGAVTSGALLRALGTLGLGSFALWRFGSASSLLIAVAIAHILAALPVTLRLRQTIWASGFVWPAPAIYAQLWRYGWPLIIAGGAAAVASYIDRILLEHFFGAASVGPYGATLDFIKQSFVIVGETITVSYVSRAKFLHGDAMLERSRAALRQAFITAAFLATFGVTFYVLLGNRVFSVLLGPGYQTAMPLVPLLAFANACLILRAYYFAQTIYFTNSVRLELWSTLLALGLSAVLSFWLIPIYSITGAAIAYTVAQCAALGMFLLNPQTRRVMPVDIGRLTKLVATALAMVIVGELAKHLLGDPVAAPFNVLLIAGVSGLLLVRWDMFDAGHLWQGFGRVLRLARSSRY